MPALWKQFFEEPQEAEPTARSNARTKAILDELTAMAEVDLGKPLAEQDIIERCDYWITQLRALDLAAKEKRARKQGKPWPPSRWDGISASTGVVPEKTFDVKLADSDVAEMFYILRAPERFAVKVDDHGVSIAVGSVDDIDSWSGRTNGRKKAINIKFIFQRSAAVIRHPDPMFFGTSKLELIDAPRDLLIFHFVLQMLEVEQAPVGAYPVKPSDEIIVKAQAEIEEAADRRQAAVVAGQLQNAVTVQLKTVITDGVTSKIETIQAGFIDIYSWDRKELRLRGAMKPTASTTPKQAKKDAESAVAFSVTQGKPITTDEYFAREAAQRAKALMRHHRKAAMVAEALGLTPEFEKDGDDHVWKTPQPSKD